MPVYNADGTLNANGSIEGYTQLQEFIEDHSEQIELAVTNLGNTDIFLGLDWLRFHNPLIDWSHSTVVFDRCPDKCGYSPWWQNPENLLQHWHINGDRFFLFDWEGYITKSNHLRTVNTFGYTMDRYVKEDPAVFHKEGFDLLPERQSWDHAIELTPGSKPVDCKVYPLNLNEQKVLDEFLEENLQSGQI